MVFSSRLKSKSKKMQAPTSPGSVSSPRRRSKEKERQEQGAVGGTAPIPIASSMLEPPAVASSGSVSPAPFSVSPLTPENGHRSRKGRAPSPPRPSQPSSLRLNGGRSGRQACANSPLPSPWVEEALNATAYGFSEQQLDTLKEAFNFFDIDRDGRITCPELLSVFKFLGNEVTEAEVELMINEADIDGNGTVELNEFLRMMRKYYRKHEPPKTEEEEMLEAFKAFDHNGDCYIDFDEIKKTMHFLGEAVSDEEVRAMIREADVDKDGRINFEEFKKMMSLMRVGPVAGPSTSR